MSKHKAIKRGIKFSLTGSVAILFLSIVWVSTARVNNKYHFDPNYGFSGVPVNSLVVDSPPAKPIGPLHYPFDDNSYGDPQNNVPNNTLYLSNPNNIKTNYVYNADSNNFTVTQTMGDLPYRPPMEMSLEEYSRQDFDKQLKSYWKQRTHAENLNVQKKKGLVPKLYINNEYFDRIFGGNTVDIRPNGSAELIFAANISKTDNPSLPVKQRRISTFDFNEKIQLNVIGKIGDKLKLTTNYNTEAAFEFENQMKLEYTGYEDDIIKKIEAGNVSLPLTGTLITGSQSLFGIKTQLQFGRTTVTSVLSQQKGKKSEIEVKGGAQTNTFEIKGDNYEANKHYFLAQYFRDRYDAALSNLPVVVSGINITKVEVWVTNNVSSTGETRNIVALTDLGEDQGNISNPLFVPIYPPGFPGALPDDTNNILSPPTLTATLRANNFDPRSISTISSGLTSIWVNLNLQKDFETVSLAKKLSPSEFTVNPRLGYISLNSQLNPDQVLAVAFQYTDHGNVYQVGEFSTDGIAAPGCLYAKMLKSTNVSTRRDSLLWDLMMKNVYSIGAYQLRPDNFKLEVLYNNPTTGTYVNTLPESTIPISGKALIQVMGLDHINTQLSGGPDGVFDFIDGVTINSQNGRVYFPVTEPFGRHLNNKIVGSPPDINLQVTANKYVFQQLYDSTKTAAQQFPDKNRYIMRGSYTSASGSDISLNAANIPTGSVSVTAGGVPLTENVDYTVDYALGRVKIINEGILQSGTPIKISLESNSLFSIQSKTMMATRIDYRISKDFSLGSTIMRLSEKPLTQKVNIGDEPIKNTVIGLDGNYRTEAPWLTRLVDKLPFLSTKEMSTITSSFEVAKLFPGHAKAIGKTGTAYIDDFEGSQTTIDIKNVGAWTLASVPQNNILFPEASQSGLASGFNRAKIAWYVIDPIFLRADNNLPSNINPTDQSNNLVREILQTELFPNKQSPSGQPINIPTLDLAYYPGEIGPYNYDTTATPNISAGVNTNGSLNLPQTRWGGIMRKIETNDFEAANVQFIQFWVMDPYVRDATGNSTDYTTLFPNAPPTGDLYFHIGDISEDILKDGQKSFENGLPTPDNPLQTDSTVWGRVPLTQSIVNAFANGSNAEADRTAQDVGLDGLINGDEQTFFNPYLSTLALAYGFNSVAYQTAASDPSHDYYHYYRGTDYDAANVKILGRYKAFNGMEGNSPVSTSGPYPTSATTIPNTEDVNRDNNLSLNESYYQYKVKINPIDISPTNVGNNYITNVYQSTTRAIDQTDKVVTWYQFKIPVKEFLPQDKIGNIEDFKSIRFIRVFMKGFSDPMVIRFAKLDLVRGEWRKYAFDLTQPGEYIPVDNTIGTTFDISAVNYEENGSKSPVNYVLPPAITQEVDVQTANLVKLNEQALSLKVCGLRDGDSRACYKNVDLDVRSYKKLKMFVHGESFPGTDALSNGDLTVFVRLGTDYTDNYYEYEIPLYITQPGNYNNNTDDDRRKVWRVENDMNLVFADLQRAKQGRNDKLATHTPGYSLTDEYVTYITDEEGYQRIIRIKGNPNLSTIKTIMMGIRNPKKTVTSVGDDGRDKCAEVWVNELRLTDFNEQGGWAATTRVTAKLADFGTLSLAGNISTPGWGSIDKKVSERQKETNIQYDVSAQLELGKFIPKKYNIHIPMFVGFSEARVNPQYNPQDPDIELSSIFSSPELSKAYKDSIRRETQDYTRRKSINFTNVKKDKGKGQIKNHIYDIENFSLNASYTELYNHSFTVKDYLVKDYRGGIAYNYTMQPKNIRPFAKMKIFSPKSLSLIRDFNFYPYPNKLSFVTDMDRHYSQRLIRNTTGDQSLNIDTTYEKHWNWLRGYDMSFDLAKSLKLVYSADNSGQIREPDGKIDSDLKRDSIRDQIYALGTNTRFNQKVKVDYTIPINKFPMMDWVTATASYTGNFDWIRSSFLADTMGNTLQNNGMKQLNAQLNMTTLYNKIPYLKKLNQRIAKKTSSTGKETPDKKLPTSDKNDPKLDTAKKKKKDDNQYEILDYVARTIIMLKNVSLTYSNNGGMIIPGYLGRTEVMGLNPSAAYTGAGFAAPGAGFVFGQQRDPREQLVKDDLLTKASYNTPFTSTSLQNISGRANIEPLPDFKIEVTANRNQSKTFNEYFAYDNLAGEFQHLTPAENGTFSMSYNMLKTSFEKQEKDFSSEVYTKFLDVRNTMSTRLHNENSNNSTTQLVTGFWNGYGATQQDVMMFAFLSAYSGGNENNYSLNPFPAIPKPNWRVTYDGLVKIPAIKKRFKTFTLSHMYRSSMSYAYTTNLNYAEANGGASAFNSNGDLIVQKQITSVSLTEQFSPLIKVDMAMTNRITGNVEIKKDRNVGLSFANSQVTEINGHEYIFGAGYRIPNFKFSLSKKKSAKKFSSDLVLKTDLSIRKNVTVIRKVVENVIQPTAGQTVVSIKVSADYVLSERLNIRLFYDQVITHPAVSTSFNTSNINSGISIRFTLSQ